MNETPRVRRARPAKRSTRTLATAKHAGDPLSVLVDESDDHAVDPAEYPERVDGVARLSDVHRYGSHENDRVFITVEVRVSQAARVGAAAGQAKEVARHAVDVALDALEYAVEQVVALTTQPHEAQE